MTKTEICASNRTVFCRTYHGHTRAGMGGKGEEGSTCDRSARVFSRVFQPSHEQLTMCVLGKGRVLNVGAAQQQASNRRSNPEGHDRAGRSEEAGLGLGGGGCTYQAAMV
jgi:hypothetical protein